MATTRTLALVVSLVAGVVGLAIQPRAYAASCEALVGKWAWFTGGIATIHPDGTMAYANPDGSIVNNGTWECTDAARGMFTLRWRLGGFVNSLALSPDGQGLSSTDMSQWYVTAQRVGASTQAKAAAKAQDVPPTQAAVGSIPSLNAKVTALRFFEMPYNAPPREQRQYKNRFGTGEARFIGWELHLAHPAPGRRVDLPIEQVWYRADGTVFGRQTLQTHVEADWTSSFPYHSWGWKDRGNWPAGAYRLELYVGGQQVASGAFKIFAAPNDAIVARNEGLALHKAKKFHEAMPYYDRAIRLYPEYAEAYNSRCSAYSDLRKYDQAMSDCNRAIHIEPGYADAYHHRGAIYERTG